MASVIRNCFEKTTAHGLPQIAMQKSIIMKIIWTILFLAASAVFIVHLRSQIIEFLSEDTKISITENQVPFEFPDIYICNSRPLAYSSMLMDNMEPIQTEIMNEIDQIKATIDVKNDNSYKTFWATIDPYRLFDAFGYEKADNDPDNFDVVTTQDKYDIKWTASDVSNDQYFQCEYNNMSKVGVAKYILKFVFHSYTDAVHPDNSNITIYNAYKLEDLSYRNAPMDIVGRQGYRIYFTEKNVYPHEGSAFVAVNPGESTSIYLTMTKYNAFSTNPQPCRDEDTYVYYVNKILDPISRLNETNRYKKTQMDCRIKKVINFIVNHVNCSCIPYWMPVEVDDYQKYRTCANVTYWKEQKQLSKVKLEMDCDGIAMDYLKNMDVSECAEERPCTRSIYSAWTSISRMDPNAYKKSFDGDFDGTKPIRGVNLFNRELDALPDLDKKNAFIDQNFVEFIIQPNQLFGSQSDESLAYTIVNLFSDIAGIVGLYLGASVLTFGEIFNILYDFIELCIFRKQAAQNNSNHPYAVDSDKEKNVGNGKPANEISSYL